MHENQTLHIHPLPQHPLLFLLIRTNIVIGHTVNALQNHFTECTSKSSKIEIIHKESLFEGRALSRDTHYETVLVKMMSRLNAKQ